MVEPRKPLVMKHNPGFLAADELIASFIARQAQLESLLETLRHNTTQSNQHILVIGRRGMGKTMLVHRLALAIERDAELATRWYPISFGEEAYGVSTAGEFWLEALHQLATQTNDPRWRRAHVELRKEKDDRRLRDLALARLLDFADERGARLMIVVENLQDILGDQMPEDAGWELRHTLLNEPRIMLLATATNRFEDVEQPKKAMYELFGVLKLQPLARDEVRVIWQRLTGELLQDQRIRPIEIFTGGSPRLLAILASFARGRTLEAFMTEILGLVDDHSEYFKSNIEALSREERRAFTALCELWEPSPARAVAEVARFDVNKTSMLLGRLVDRGAVEIVRARGRTQYYQVCERLYGLFHRLRRSSTQDTRVSSIVEFMTRFYSEAHDASEPDPAQMQHVALALSTSGTEQALDVLEALARENPAALHRLLDIHRETLLQLALANPERLHAIISSIPLFEPLAFALAQELGHDVLAPYEVTEIAKDIRAEIAKLRGPTYSAYSAYSVAIPHLAIAAEDAPRPLRSKKPAKRRKPSKR